MIENEFYEDDFEQLLKEKADQFSMYPSKRVWHSIYNNLHPGRRWPSVVISLVLISSLMLIGYLNTGENSITSQINNNTFSNTADEKNNEVNINQKNMQKTPVTAYTQTVEKPSGAYSNAFEDMITNKTDIYTYTIVRSNRPVYLQNTATATDAKTVADIKLPVDNTVTANNTPQDIVQSVDAYIKSNKIFSDIADNNKKYKTSSSSKATDKNINTAGEDDAGADAADMAATSNDHLDKSTNNIVNTNTSKLPEAGAKAMITATTKIGDKKNVNVNEEKAWIENYALQNKSASKKWKGRLGYQVYVTPAVNYRKLTTKTKYSATPFAEGDINNSISQKPGVGIEAGVGLNYAVAKRLQFKGGVQFNYTNYNIAAIENNHPVATDILLNDPASGLSYASARTTTTSNAYNSGGSTPVTLHNTTYQLSIPVGLAYKLSSKNNVDWFAGASVQPSYFFGGNAHIVSSDLKSYVSEPSSIRSWNLNLGFETYMNFKLGTYNLQVGPQVRYQVHSTYKKDIALIEKPYAIGLKFGLTKGF